ncbi:hypothetical protein A6S26_23195 [Nostoc sp. ATCC 43529]|nr:hypothetical protein A6S26_23195 [Nostoc sp. ATCC 43529]
MEETSKILFPPALFLKRGIIIGQQAQTALSNLRMVGTETFTAELKRLAALDDNMTSPFKVNVCTMK